MKIVDTVHLPEPHSCRTRWIVLLKTLDVRNAFNSVRWTDMLGTLGNLFYVPSYLLRILRDYLNDRFLLYETLERQRRIDRESNPAVKYLVSMLDSKMSFFEQFKAASDRAEALLMGATESVLHCGEQVWADALDKEVHRKGIAQVHRRGALRVASAYRTVSKPAVMVIAGMIHIAVLAKKRKAIYRRKGENLGEVVAREERQRTLTEWQFSWQNEPRGKWTVLLIDNLDPWLNRTRGEIDFRLTQLLNGYGGFQSYLHRIGKARSLIVYFAMEWWMTLNNPFSLTKGGTAFVSSFMQT